MATTITAGNSTNGAAVSSDNTGILELKTGTGSGTTAVTIGTDQSVTFAQAANLPNTFGFKNRIINGAMVIDQRNAGAAVTSNNNTIYAVDRFSYFTNGSATGTMQQSSVAPTGFTNSLLYTIGSGSASSSTTRAQLIQRIEGYNTADLAWGTASAKSITLSFWVRSSLTGTFGGALQNSAQDRSYPFTYTISAANTWEKKSVPITGDTTGTWLTTNGNGVQVYWDMGCGSSLTTTAGAWASGDYRGATGTTSVVATTGATFYLTGCQFEVGTVATSFDYRPYGTELMLCQRYYWKMFPNDASRLFGSGQCFSTTAAGVQIPFEVQMRTRPTSLEQSGTASHYKVLNSAGSDIACSAVPTYNAATTDYMAWVALTVASGIVAGNGTTCLTNNAAAYLGWSAEL